MRRPEQSHASLEKELIVIEKTYGSDLADAPAAVKRRARMIKNRLSAKKSREQAREYVTQLENTVKVLSAESELLARRLAQVEAENRIMRQNGYESFLPSSSSSSSRNAGRASDDDDQREKKRIAAEPAALRQPSLQLDALLLLMVASSASGEANLPSTGALLKLRPLLARAALALLATKPAWLRRRPRTRLRPPALTRRRSLQTSQVNGWKGDRMQ